MIYQELFNLLSEIGIPVAYDHFDSNKDIIPPFLVYRDIASETFKADQEVYYRPYEFEIELVTKKKDVELQSKLEELLTKNKIPYDILDDYWDKEERIYHNYYEI